MWAGALSFVAVGGIGVAPLLGQPPIRPAKTEIRAISKVVVGTNQTKDVSTVKCEANGNVTHVYDVSVTADVRSFNCDECPSNPEWNQKFVAQARVTRREDPQQNHRGCFEGRWRFVNAAGGTIAAGKWHGTVECGTHGGLQGLDCEPCAVPEHFEGCLDGLAPRRNLPGGPTPICATVAGFGMIPNTAGAQPVFRMRIEGAVTVRCGLECPPGGG